MKKVRVKPNPDPECPKRTSFMTKQEIKYEAMLPSKEWVDVGGGGHLGKLYLEILSCHDLPNMDVGEAVGNVTDPFVCAIFEDAMVQTPVLNDELSPHWLPWTQRAFVFNVMYPSSMLYLGVFDYDMGPLNPHEPIGRVAINLSHLKAKNTVYTLRYDLHPSANLTERVKNGTITIRLRMEIDEKAALMAGLKPRPRIYVNVQKEKSFRVARYTCCGEVDTQEKFDLPILRSYINEILEYKRLIAYAVSDSFKSIVFWRGQVGVGSFMLPLHSLAFFLSAIILVERPQLLPSFTCIGIGWFMMATMTLRLNHPSPWHQCISFWYFIHILKHGHAPERGISVEPFENRDKQVAYESAWQQRLNQDREKADEMYKLRQQVDAIGNDAIQTKVQSGMDIELLSRLGRWQGIVGRILRFLRRIKLVILWEDNLTAFWLAAVFLGVGIVSLILPWKFILTWVGRIVVWGLMGPHMFFVDMYIAAKAKNHEEALKEMIETFQAKSREARLKREEAVKLRAIKVLNFGEYVTEVPGVSLDRHYDRALPESSARPVRKDAIKINTEQGAFLPGQQLYGVMIPRSEYECEKNKEFSSKEAKYFEPLARLLEQQGTAGELCSDAEDIQNVASMTSTEQNGDIQANSSLRSRSQEAAVIKKGASWSSVFFKNETVNEDEPLLTSREKEEENQILPKPSIVVEEDIIYEEGLELIAMDDSQMSLNLNSSSDLGGATVLSSSIEEEPDDQCREKVKEATAAKKEKNDKKEMKPKSGKGALSAVYKSSETVNVAFSYR